jgi:hypothetical protein
VPPHDANKLDGADIRGFYAALGIPLPGWACGDVSVRCFADPDAHARGDRDPSCSVNLTHGAWHCHGCGASGGPYDAAVYQGHGSRSAIDLMIWHGLTERRARYSWQRQHPILRNAGTRPRVVRPTSPRFTISETDINHWRSALSADTTIVERLVRERGWQLETMRELELGVDRGRITIPVRDHERRLVGLLRYRPSSRPRQSKMKAAAGSRRELLPHPSVEQSASIWLVEGEPDMIAARSRGLPAIAVPGSDSWRSAWAPLLAGRDVTVVLDCDRQGRAAARRIAQDLGAFARTWIFDLAPDRDDGFDVTNWLATTRAVDPERLR